MMAKRAFLCFFAGLALFTGYAKAQDRVVIDKVAAVVGNSVILYSDIEEYKDELKEYYKQQGMTTPRDPQIEALEALMMQKLLYNQAQIDSIKVGNISSAAQEAEDQVNALVQQLGGVKMLEEMFHRPIFEIKKEFADRIEERMYAQNMQYDITSEVSVIPGEVERFYKKLDKDSLPIIPIQYVYAQITKYPLSTEEAKLRARERLLEMRERIINGNRFDVLAQLYSQDPGSKTRGGELDPSPAENFEVPFANALEKLRPGQVSEVVETIWGFHIIQLIDKPNGLYHARHILVRPDFAEKELIQTNLSLDSLATRIRMDSISFEKAALQYSDDKYSKYNSGIVSNLEILEANYNLDLSRATTKHIIDEIPKDDSRVLQNMKVGDISDPFITMDARQNVMSKILKLIQIIPAHPANLKEDYLRIEEMAIMDKKSKSFREWVDNKVMGMYVYIAPEFRRPEAFDNKVWLK